MDEHRDFATPEEHGGNPFDFEGAFNTGSNTPALGHTKSVPISHKSDGYSEHNVPMNEHAPLPTPEPGRMPAPGNERMMNSEPANSGQPYEEHYRRMPAPEIEHIPPPETVGNGQPYEEHYGNRVDPDNGKGPYEEHYGNGGDPEKVESQPDLNKKKTKSTLLSAPAVEDTDPAAARLAADTRPISKEDFYELMGLTYPHPDGMNGIGQISKRHGLYKKIYRNFLYSQRKYKLFEFAAYFLLILQLFLSAVFIILGSLTNVDTHLTIAILGAVATVVAGSLALMKGQGLPNRLRQSRDAFKAVMFEAEELYWDVQTGREVLYSDIKKIREDYIRVLQAEKRNHPDTWTDASDMESGMGGRGKTGGGGVGGIGGARRK